VTATSSATMGPRRLRSWSTRRPAVEQPSLARLASTRSPSRPPIATATTAAGVHAGAIGAADTATASTTAVNTASTSTTGASATTSCFIDGVSCGAIRLSASARTGAVLAP
jgi:hypothetical protein